MVDGPRFESRQEQALFLFSKIVQTCFWVHPASCSMSTGFFPAWSAVGPWSEDSGLLAYGILALGEWLRTCLRNQRLYFTISPRRRHCFPSKRRFFTTSRAIFLRSFSWWGKFMAFIFCHKNLFFFSLNKFRFIWRYSLNVCACVCG